MSRIHLRPLLFGLLSVGGAAAAFAPAFTGSRWVIAILVALTVSGAVMAWSVATEISLTRTILVSIAAAVLTTIATVLNDALGASVTTTVSEFFSGVTGGWNDSLQEDLPLVQPTQPLVWATVTTWIVAAIVARALASGRAPLTVFLAPSVLLALATAITVPAGPPSRLAVAVVVIGLLGVLATTSAREIDWTLRQVRATGTVIVLATALGVGAMAMTSGDAEGALDPRTLRSDNSTDEDVPDLLAELLEITGDDPRAAAEIDVRSGARPERLRLAVYDEYDGERWRTSTTFREVLQFVPPDLQPAGDASSVQVRLLGSPGPWLPLLDRVVGIRPSIRGWDEESTTALADARIATVIGSVVTRASIDNVTAGATDIDPRFTALPAATPPSILDLATSTVTDTADARAAVSALEEVVLTMGRDDDVPGGHSLGRLLADIEAAEPMAPEQLVALHAVLVRAVGIPSRVVVGYAVGEDDELSTADLTAWTEVAFAGVGWVPFDPVPLEQVAVEGADGDPTATTTTLPEQTVSQAQVVPRELQPGERETDDFRPGSGPGIGWVEVGMALVVVVILLIVLVVAARLLRRRNRRHAATAPWKVTGAWGELLDRLRENSGAGPPNRTVEEVIDEVEDIAPGAASPLRALTRLVNHALYSDRPPSWEQADEAWMLLDEIESSLRDAGGRSVSARARFDPRSLRYPTPRPAPNRARRPHPPRPRRGDHPRVQR